jgi:hypothetical protein
VGSDAHVGNGLQISSSSGSVIKGLSIRGFNQGINIFGDSVGNRIEGNFIGIDPFGTFGFGNDLHGVNIQEGPTQTVIGGTTPEKRNIISKTRMGSAIAIALADDNRISGNYIGTDKNGNVLSGTSDGISILSASGNTVGGTQAGAGNVIAATNFSGVSIGYDDSAGNRVLSNSIFANGALGIDLMGKGENLNTGVSNPNDPKDADTGANHLQNKPVLSSARNADGKTTLKGALHTRPIAGLSYTIQFFSNPSGTNEGQKLIGQKVVKTDGSGDASFGFTPATKVAVGRTITATATRNSNGDTSEFSAPRTVTTS